jgi:hypothetical protein
MEDTSLMFDELTIDNQVLIGGGSEASDALCYFAGAIVKCFYAFGSGVSSGGYAYCKCG